MKKLSNDQKRKRKKLVRQERKLRRKKRQESTSSKPRPWQPVKMKMYKMPDPFKKGVTLEQRREVIREAGKKIKQDFNKKYPKLEDWFKKYDALYILSFCAMYFSSSQEGIDEEATTGGLEFPYHLLELLQAFSLINKRAISLKPLQGEAEKLQKEVREIGDLMMFRFFDIPETVDGEDEMSAYHLRLKMMMQTTAVRNWAYYHQIKQTVLELAALIDEDFNKKYGIKASIFFGLIFQLIDERNDLLNDHLAKVRKFFRKNSYKKVIEAFNEVFPENTPLDGEDVEKIWEISGKNLKNLKWMMIAHSDLKLEKIFSFDIKHVVDLAGGEVEEKVIIRLLDKLSYKFGDLKNHNKEHMILDNPVHHKPFIKVDPNTYYSSIWGTISHVILDIMEGLISESPDMKNKYYGKVKSKYLEDKVEKIFRESFPDAQVIRGLLWNDNENDLLVIIDSFAIIVEDKARLVSPAARRGAPLDLPETLKKLIEDPSEQALGFMEYLKKQSGVIELKTRKGIAHKLDVGKIKYYVPLGVTFHHLGTIGSNLKDLIRAKVIDKDLEHLAPSMSFTDLEVLFQLLPLQSQKVHYLARRREFEAHMQYEGDELDLLGFYLDNGFNIGEVEYSREMAMNISLKSKELDPYIIGVNEGKDVEKPKLTMTQWWNDLLYLIDSRKMDGWIETSFTLLNTTIEDQQKFEKMFEELVQKTLNGELAKPHNWVMLLSGPERRRFAIAVYPYTTTDKELRNNIMSQALDSEDVEKSRGAIVIGVNIRRKDYPYSVLAGRMKTNLLDTLTITS